MKETIPFVESTSAICCLWLDTLPLLFGVDAVALDAEDVAVPKEEESGLSESRIGFGRLSPDIVEAEEERIGVAADTFCCVLILPSTTGWAASKAKNSNTYFSSLTAS
ncbi:hypothetical protein [Zymomonas mobilis]|uniref:hypothetical protein n=1 Tax=Zymomonas mobilis TaxID=542 RepID=UPI001F46AF99|nr:hypothetical protein [Zymomonas mobilis]